MGNHECATDLLAQTFDSFENWIFDSQVHLLGPWNSTNEIIAMCLVKAFQIPRSVNKLHTKYEWCKWLWLHGHACVFASAILHDSQFSWSACVCVCVYVCIRDNAQYNVNAVTHQAMHSAHCTCCILTMQQLSLAYA